mgnify:FL=1
MKLISRTMRILNRKKTLVLFIMFLIILLALYKSDKIMIEYPKNLAEHIYSKTNTNIDLLPLWKRLSGALFRLEDEINIFRVKKNLLDGELPIYSLELNPNDLMHFDNLSREAIKSGYLSPELNNWRKAKLQVNGKEYKVETRFHGDIPDHWANELKSYQIKSDKDEYINNMRRFNLIIFEDRLFSSLIGRVVAKKFGLMDIRDDIVVLKINGVIQGVYYLQERLDENFLEYNECSTCYIIGVSDNWVDDHKYDIGPYKSADPNGIFWATGHRTAFDYEMANADVDTGQSNISNVLYAVSKLYDSVNNKDTGIIDYFDKNQLSSLETFRMLTGNVHSIAGDNFRMVYSATNSKFYPVPLIEVSTKLKLERGGIEHYLNTFGRPIDLFYLLARDDELRHLTHKKIYSFLLDNTILEEYDQIIKRYESYALSYKTNKLNIRHLKYAFKEQKDILKYNIDIIRKNLEYSKFYVNVIQKGNKIDMEIIPDSIAEIRFKKFAINLKEAYSGEIIANITSPNNLLVIRSMNVKDKNVIDLTDLVSNLYFSAGLDENLYPEVRKYPIKITFSDASRINIGNMDIKVLNDITNIDIAKDDSYVQIADANNYYENSKHLPLADFQKLYPNLKWSYNDGGLILLEGNYIMDRDLIIPKQKNLIIQAGVNIKIAEGKSILSYSPVTFAGTKEKPIVITSLEKNKPYGTFAIVGNDNPDEKVSINWLDISGGKDKWLNGIFFIGQFSIHNTPTVYVNNSLIHGSMGDDGINIKYANILIENSKFYGNTADQVDLDFVQGMVKNSEFNGKGELDSNGDGLDLSGSRVIVKNNIFTNLLDKGISIGEDTKAIVYKNTLLNNNLGVAVKDLSKGYFIDNTFKNNKIAVAAYQKKQLFGGGSVYVYKNNFNSNQKDFEQDNPSDIHKINLVTEDYKKLKENAEREILSFS